MKLFLAIAMLMLGLLATARAQQEADEQYLVIYSLIQQADALIQAGEPRDADAVLTQAQGKLQHFQKLYPEWNPTIVNYRLDDIAQKIADLKGQVPASKKENAAAAAESSAKMQATMDALRAQLQSAQAENETLQAKLREALAPQPAMVNAAELARAQEQIRSLMKENELFKVSQSAPQKVVVMDTNAVAHARRELAAYVKKFSAEQALAEKLAAENGKLRASLSASAASSGTLAALSSQNAKLKDQIASLQAMQKSAPAKPRFSAELADARNRIAALNAAAAVSGLEKTALENKLRKLSDDLAGQRNALLQPLEAANGKISGHTSADTTAQLAALNEELKTLRARVDVDESKPVPFTKEELALFRQNALPPVNPQSTKRALNEWPAGTADLVVSAQKHFSNHEFDQAEADYLKILEHDQNNGLALANLATIELQEDKLAGAEKHIQAAVAQNPDDAYDLSTLGYLKFRQGKYDEAFNALSRAAQLDPKNPEIQNYLGVTLSHKGLRQQAENALRQAIELNPGYAPAHNNLAVIYLNQNPPSPMLARWHYQKALDAGQPRNLDLEKMLADKGAPVAVP